MSDQVEYRQVENGRFAMNRRLFFKTMLGLPLLAQWVNAEAVAYAHSTLLLETQVAGFQYYEGERLWPRLSPGDPLTLVREPANPYDPNAIALYRQDRKLGYIPRKDNAVIANLMDQGKHLKAFVTHTRRSDNPWELMHT